MSTADVARSLSAKRGPNYELNFMILAFIFFLHLTLDS